MRLILTSCALCVACSVDLEPTSQSSSALSTGGTYDIAQGVIADHANAGEVGSIAWYFDQYGPSNTYVLDSAATYSINEMLTIPDGATLTTNAGSIISAGTGFRSDQMFLMGSGSTLSNLDLDGAHVAPSIIYATAATNVTITNARIHDTKNNYYSGSGSCAASGGSQPEPDLVVLNGCGSALISGNTLSDAGYPKVNATCWGGVARAIYTPANTNVVIENNQISNTLSGGIDLGGSTGAWVSGNSITNTGLNYLYPPYQELISDGITDYHNQSGATERQVVIANNTITNYYNQGIHTSGRQILIQGNTVTHGHLAAITVSDWRPSPDVSYDVTIRDNVVQDGSAPDPGISVEQYLIGGVAAYGNTEGGAPYATHFVTSTAMGTDFTAGVGTAANADGRLETFVIGDVDRQVYHAWQPSAGSGPWTPWVLLGGGGPGIQGGVGVAANADGRLEAFAIGTDGAMWHAWQSAGGGWSSWHSLGGQFLSGVGAATNQNGTVEVFGVGTDYQMYHAWQSSPGGSWTGWYPLGGGFIGGVGAARNLNGRLEVFGIGGDNAVWHAWQTSPAGAWSGWVSLGGSTYAGCGVAENADGRLEAFAAGGGDNLWHTWQVSPGAGWIGGWYDLGGGISAGVGATTNLNGRVVAFAIGSDAHVWHIWQTSPGGAWSSWARL
jgi:hypothetical protein